VGDGGPCLDEVRDVCADGTFDGHRIRVRWPGAVPPSAFAHEHIHAWLLLATGDGDAAHARGPWFMEARINDVLHARGF
jgi:hypothetical protein